MKGAILWRAEMEGVDLGFSNPSRAIFWEAQKERAIFDFSHLTYPSDKAGKLLRTIISAAKNNGDALRNVDLTSVTFDAHTDFLQCVLGQICHPSSWFQEANETPMPMDNRGVG